MKVQGIIKMGSLGSSFREIFVVYHPAGDAIVVVAVANVAVVANAAVVVDADADDDDANYDSNDVMMITMDDAQDDALNDAETRSLNHKISYVLIAMSPY